MTAMQWAAFAVAAAFYAAYGATENFQRSGGVKLDRTGKDGKAPAIDRLSKIAVCFVMTAEAVSVGFDLQIWRSRFAFRLGVGIALAGVAVLIAAILSLLVGRRAQGKTEFPATGICRVSRNPQVFGFILVSVGLLIGFFNYIHLFFVVLAFIMLHMRVLQEEKLLTATFGQTYVEYKKRAGRYFWVGRALPKKKTVAVCLAAILCSLGALGGFLVCGANQRKNCPNFRFGKLWNTRRKTTRTRSSRSGS